MHINRQFFGRIHDIQAQAILIATMHGVGISCVDLGHVAFYWQRFLVLSIEVRAYCDSAIDFTDKKMVSVVACELYNRSHP